MRPFHPTSTLSKERSLRTFGSARDGGVAVTVAVMSVVLVGILALSIDLSRLYNASTERNNAADAAAIVAATQLGQGQFSCNRAINAAVHADLANQETFVGNRSNRDVYISDIGSADGSDAMANPNIKFLSELVKDDNGNVIGTYIDDNDACGENANFVEVTADKVATGDDARVDFYFAGVVGALTSAFPRGYAIAEHGKAFCNVPPMMMCALAGGEGVTFDTPQDFWNAVENYSLTGRGLLLKSGTNSTQWGSGNFGFLRIDGAGAKELGELIGSVGGHWDCYGPDKVLETEPGNNSGARWAFNTRFDMYHGSMSSYADDPAYQPAPNTVKGLVRNGSSCGWGGGGYGDPAHPYTGPGMSDPEKAQIEAMPLPMDECAYGAAGTCAAIDNLGRLGDGNWDRETYFSVNHSMESWEAPITYGPTALLNPALNPACVVDPTFEDIDYDGPGGTIHPDCSMSRYETYLWELGRSSTSASFASVSASNHLVDNTGPAGAPDGPGMIPQTREHAGQGRPQCYDPLATMGNYTTASGTNVTLRRDRRVVQALVINCDPDNGGVEIQGKSEIPLGDPNVNLGTIELFVLEPWQVNGGEHQISTEIIGPGELDGDHLPTLVKEWINLKESRKAQQ